MTVFHLRFGSFPTQAVVKRILSSFFGFIFGFLGLGSIYVRGLASASGIVIGCGSGRYFLVRVRFFLLTCSVVNNFASVTRDRSERIWQVLVCQNSFRYFCGLRRFSRIFNKTLYKNEILLNEIISRQKSTKIFPVRTRLNTSLHKRKLSRWRRRQYLRSICKSNVYSWVKDKNHFQKNRKLTFFSNK